MVLLEGPWYALVLVTVADVLATSTLLYTA